MSAVPNESRFVRKKPATRFVVGQKSSPQTRLIIAAVMCHAGAGHIEDVSLAVREIPSLEQSIELRRDHQDFFAVLFLLEVKPNASVGVNV